VGGGYCKLEKIRKRKEQNQIVARLLKRKTKTKNYN